MGRRVERARSEREGLPEVRAGAAGRLRASDLWVGVLDAQERQPPLEHAVDDPERVHHAGQLAEPCDHFTTGR